MCPHHSQACRELSHSIHVTTVLIHWYVSSLRSTPWVSSAPFLILLNSATLPVFKGSLLNCAFSSELILPWGFCPLNKESDLILIHNIYSNSHPMDIFCVSTIYQGLFQGDRVTNMNAVRPWNIKKLTILEMQTQKQIITENVVTEQKHARSHTKTVKDYVVSLGWMKDGERYREKEESKQFLKRVIQIITTLIFHLIPLLGVVQTCTITMEINITVLQKDGHHLLQDPALLLLGIYAQGCFTLPFVQPCVLLLCS